MRILLGVCLFVIIPALSIFWGGYVGSVLWGWFVVPLGAPPIGTLHSAGLACIVSLFMGKRGLDLEENSRKSTEDKLVEGLALVVMLPLVPLVFGWLIKAGM